MRWLLAGASMSLLAMAFPSDAQPIRIGELNSYKAQAAFLEPYRKGWALALEEMPRAGCWGVRLKSARHPCARAAESSWTMPTSMETR